MENDNKLTEDLKLENRIIFMSSLEHRQMAEYLKKSDIFIRPSLSEGLGSSFLEAMACGLPVVASNISVHKELFFSTVILAEHNNVDSFVNSINSLLNNNQLKRELIKNGLSRCRSFSWKNVALNTLKIFNFIEEQRLGRS